LITVENIVKVIKQQKKD